MQAQARANPYNTIVIGAGAAGLAAARTLQDAGRNVLILEARNRIGGRVHSNYDFAPHPVELGAEFLHGENIISWNWLRQQGLTTLPAFEDDRNLFMYIHQALQSFRRWADIPGTEVLDGIGNAQLYRQARAWVAARKPDISLGQFLLEHDVVMAPEVHRILDNYFSGSYGANLEQLGIYGLLELSYEGDGEEYFRVQEGYTQLLEPLAAGLSIHYQSPVTHIAWHRSPLEIHTAATTYTAEQVVITLPLALLQSNAVTFDPALPASKGSAINGLGVGQANKVIFKFAEPFWPEAMEACLTTLSSQMWWRPGWQRPGEAPLLTAFLGANAALEFSALSRLGQGRVTQELLGQLERMFALPLASHVVDVLYVDWSADPYARMGYSYTPVNGTGLRARLAEPLGNALFFAGEATHSSRAASVHGALESGIRAAQEILALR